MKKDYNKLTVRLLEEGYTADSYPDHVKIGTGQLTGNDPLNNLYGGFEYKRWYTDEIVYQTGCGRLVYGRNVIANMSCEGVDWSHENDSPVIRCPFDIPDCPQNDPRLHGTRGGGLCIQCFCVCHQTATPYDYENSIEKLGKEQQEEKKRKYEEYADAHNGRVCENHMYFDERTKEWHLRYEPARCANMCSDAGKYCPILGKKLSRKRANVYYDVKTIRLIQQKSQRTLLDGTESITIEKAVRFFKKPCSVDICNAFVRVQSEEIQRKYRWNHSNEKFVDPSWHFEIQNIRVEARPSRDLAQDLEDIKAGIYISFDPDSEKNEKARKKEKREAAKKKRIEKLEKKILAAGYENLEESSLDRIHADRWLTKERIEEMGRLRQEKMAEEKKHPVQMTMEDFI